MQLLFRLCYINVLLQKIFCLVPLSLSQYFLLLPHLQIAHLLEDQEEGNQFTGQELLVDYSRWIPMAIGPASLEVVMQ